MENLTVKLFNEIAEKHERKLLRILSVENSKNNSFRQHITDVKNYLLSELNATNTSE